ncbi:MAG: small acid-soluble spore protein Tlp [Desulfosporosinus sp.]|nr:small acid-soluble spore protein Tlp [Desulfosporosinus sp.]
MAKPNKKAHLQDHIDHTAANLHEAEGYLDEHANEITASKKQAIEASNDRREESIKGFAAKINHEAQN